MFTSRWTASRSTGHSRGGNRRRTGRGRGWRWMAGRGTQPTLLSGRLVTQIVSYLFMAVGTRKGRTWLHVSHLSNHRGLGSRSQTSSDSAIRGAHEKEDAVQEESQDWQLDKYYWTKLTWCRLLQPASNWGPGAVIAPRWHIFASIFSRIKYVTSSSRNVSFAESPIL
jgi:hypothetical protein